MELVIHQKPGLGRVKAEPQGGVFRHGLPMGLRFGVGVRHPFLRGGFRLGGSPVQRQNAPGRQTHNCHQENCLDDGYA